MDQKPDSRQTHQGRDVGQWMITGLLIGLCLGIVFNNLAMGMVYGMLAGIIVGSVLVALKQKRNHEN